MSWTKSSRSSVDELCVEIWRKSSHSVESCVEVANPADRVLIRDTKDRQGPVLSFEPKAFQEFINWL